MGARLRGHLRRTGQGCLPRSDGPGVRAAPSVRPTTRLLGTEDKTDLDRAVAGPRAILSRPTATRDERPNLEWLLNAYEELLLLGRDRGDLDKVIDAARERFSLLAADDEHLADARQMVAFLLSHRFVDSDDGAIEAYEFAEPHGDDLLDYGLLLIGWGDVPAMRTGGGGFRTVRRCRVGRRYLRG
ncbi:hypothetical protein ACTG9Q_13205 [Actinokineospora sp. 24-640]